MNATIQKWGNSLALRIPQAVARQIRIHAGDEVILEVGTAGLSIKPARPKYTLDELLAGVTDENIHAETDWGSSVGKEIVP